VDDPESEMFLGIHGASFRGEDALRRFTAETGGEMYQGSDWGQLVTASRRIREEMKTQYRLGYVPVRLLAAVASKCAPARVITPSSSYQGGPR
jgi:hypothetical protein